MTKKTPAKKSAKKSSVKKTTKQQTPKLLPYGNADFRRLRTQNCIYVDKTRFIELLESESNNNSKIFIRPRRFGKSLFLSTLSYYYDINYKDEFDLLFGDLYIGQNPTQRRNSYAVMGFNFSGIDTSSADDVKTSFFNNIRNTIYKFLGKYKNIFPDVIDARKQTNNQNYSALAALDWAFSIADEAGIKIFVIIDEYDHFANDLIAKDSISGDELYKTIVAVNGFVRDFYEKLKIGSDTGIIDQTFITGISPVMLDDLTSGYNIATNYSLDKRYNEMLGFTQDEVIQLRDAVGIKPEQIKIDMEYYYNGYLFNENAKNKVYNSSMIIYFFGEILKNDRLNLVDFNLSIDPQRLIRLVKNDKNRDVLIQIIKEGGIVSQLLEKFSIDNLNNDNYFVSLLFYMGLLTIKESVLDELRLVIPNYSIRTSFWSYLRELVTKYSPEVKFDIAELRRAITALAMEGNLEVFISYISQNILGKLSDYDLQRFDEKYIKVMLLSYLHFYDPYIPMSEYEAAPGRIDIFLQSNPKYSAVKYEWVWELKYCKTGASKKDIDEAKKKGLEQLNQYITSHRLKNRPNLKSALLIFIGKNKYEIIENN